MKMKDKGSAIVLAVLLLSFFLSLSLNIYFIAQRKGEAAGVKVEGERITSSIDMASSLGYQELYMAENFVRLGFPYKGSHGGILDGYSEPSGDDVYFDPMSGTYNDKYTGIQLTNLIDYFTSHWDYEAGGAQHQKLIMSEDVIIEGGNDVVESRMWQSGGVPEKAIPLWKTTASTVNAKKVSIGGYHLTELVVGTNDPVAVDFDSNPQQIIENAFGSGNGTESVVATYTKFITLGTGDEDLDISTMRFRFEIQERFSAVKANTSDSFDQFEFYGRGISKFSVRYIDE